MLIIFGGATDVQSYSCTLRSHVFYGLIGWADYAVAATSTRSKCPGNWLYSHRICVSIAQDCDRSPRFLLPLEVTAGPLEAQGMRVVAMVSQNPQLQSPIFIGFTRSTSPKKLLLFGQSVNGDVFVTYTLDIAFWALNPILWKSARMKFAVLCCKLLSGNSFLGQTCWSTWSMLKVKGLLPHAIIYCFYLLANAIFKDVLFC